VEIPAPATLALFAIAAATYVALGLAAAVGGARKP
jgi:hypothetical protein